MPALPSRTAVYRLFDADGALLYVGMSYAPERRIRDHRRQRAWWPQVASISIEWFATRYRASLAEAKAINTENPVHNVHQTPPWRERQRSDALSISPEARRNRSIGRKAQAAKARALAELCEQGVPYREALRQAQLIREQYLAAHPFHRP
ncbi:GIY-YIG nuclease family protein [Streptomyces sp. enrichment culture]|uniref:GIY-YIG nuclease family protein n=1 Tax=Streptomyces sp. enrichment culture TaxID=1795815 RepID=UPI003F569EEB